MIAPVWFSFLWQSDVQMENKHTSMWIILIKLKIFCLEENFFLGQNTREKSIESWQIFYGKIK